MNLRSFITIGMVSAALSAIVSCGNKTQSISDDGDSVDISNIIPQDSTIFGICCEGTGMNTVQLLTDSGDTLSIDISLARDSDYVFGGLMAGDRLAILATVDKKSATKVINISTLLGDWVMPNPIDGSSIQGISLKEGGIAESINQGSIVYKTWKIEYGHLALTSSREIEMSEEETTLYDFVSLGADSLVYRDAEDDYKYSRR